MRGVAISFLPETVHGIIIAVLAGSIAKLIFYDPQHQTKMLSKLLVAWCLMALCVAIHSAGLIMTLRFLKRQVLSIEKHAWIAVWTLVRIAGATIFLHLLQIAVWAVYYSLAGAIPDLTSAFYFSAVTYTTTGYGDLVLPEEWRLIGGVEALTGILMCGLSTGMFFVLFSRTLGIDRSDKPST